MNFNLVNLKIMEKYWKILLVIFIVMLVSGFFVKTAEAGALGDAIRHNLFITQDAAKLPSTADPTTVVAAVIKGALGVVAIIFFIIIVIAGFRWMTGGGNEESIAKAKKMISNATIGLIVIIFSYAITTLIFNLILEK